jgi:hypothetical protein
MNKSLPFYINRVAKILGFTLNTLEKKYGISISMVESYLTFIQAGIVIYKFYNNGATENTTEVKKDPITSFCSTIKKEDLLKESDKAVPNDVKRDD